MELSNARIVRQGGFHVLLVVLLASIFLYAYADSHPFVLRGLEAAVLLAILAMIRSVRAEAANWRAGWGLAAVWIGLMVLRWLSMFTEVPVAPLWMQRAHHGLEVVVFGWILVSLAVALMRMNRVSAQVLSASLCTYLMIGLWFFAVYRLLPHDHFVPELDPAEAAAIAKGDQEGRMDLFYFSFVTLTSLGYGDVTPVSPVAKSLAILEVTLGQLCLAVLIARQLGMYLAARGADPE